MPGRPDSNRTRNGQSSLIVIGIIAVVMVLAAAGIFLRTGGDGLGQSSQSDYFRVRKGGFDITLPVSGELAALKQIDIRNNLDGRAIITEIVAEGTFVHAGDIVLRLNDEEVRNKVREAQDKVNVAESALIAAQAKLEIEVKVRDLAVELAELALKAWQEGEAKTKLEELQLAVQTTQKEYQRLFDRYEQSKELVKKEFISQDELRKDEISMMQSEFDLAKAKNELLVYKEYTFHQDKAQKLSDLEQAKIEREAEIRSAKSDVDSKQFQLDSAREKLVELQQQLSYCTITAPAPGLVVYYSSTQSGGMGRNDGRPPMVGTELSRNEPVIIIPDTSKMVAAVKVSEALVGQIQIGQRASIACDAMPDQAIIGRVQSVGVLAESGGWRDPNRRDYTVKILLNNGADLGLKPAMRCKANIAVGRVEDALHVPIQAVFRNGPLSYVYVPQGGGFAQKKVVTGRSSELYVEITEGLDEGDTVLLRQPAPEEIVSRLPAPTKPTDQSPDEAAGQMNEQPLNGAMQDSSGPSTDGPPEGMRRGGNRGPGGMRPDGAGRGPGGGENTGGGSAQRNAQPTTQPAAPAAPAPAAPAQKQ